SEVAQAAPAQPAAPPSAASADIAQLQTRVAQLERKLEAALQDIAAGSGKASPVGARSGTSATRSRSAPSGIVRPRIKLDPFIAAADSPATKKLRSAWPQILEQLKAGHNM